MSRHVLITGVMRGLGRAMAEQFKKAGCDVRGCGRTTARIRELNATSSADTAFAVVDVCDPVAVDRWASALTDDGFTPDLLINNAGVINNVAPLWEVPADEFSMLMDVNVSGTFHVIRAFVPRMIEQGRGIIVNFSSGWGRGTSAEVAPYCASKWAIEGLTRALAEELPAGLAAIPVNPGIIDTDMLRQCWSDDAGHYPPPDEWARRAVPFLLKLSPEHNGQPLTIA